MISVEYLRHNKRLEPIVEISDGENRVQVNVNEFHRKYSAAVNRANQAIALARSRQMIERSRQ